MPRSFKDQDAVSREWERKKKAIVVSKEMYGAGEEWESTKAWARAKGDVDMAGNVATACRTGGRAYGFYFRYRDEPIPKPLVQVYEPVYVNAGCRE